MNPLNLPKFKLKYVVISMIICMGLFLNPMAIGQAQDLEEALGWKSFGLVGDVAYAPVRLDGHSLFSIAATRTQEKGQWGLGSLMIRRNLIENRLKSQLSHLVENSVDPESLQVIATQLNQQMIVQAILDGKTTHPIVTVTALDAEIYGLTEAELAEKYAQQIQQGLRRGIEERSPAAQQQQLQQAGIIGAIAALSIALLFGWQRQIAKVRDQLRQEFQNQQEFLIQQQAALGLDEDATQDDSEQQQQLFVLKRRIDRKTWQKRILQLLSAVVGGVGLAKVLQRFPQTRSLGILLFRQPIGLLLIGLSVTLAIIFSHLLIDRVLTKWVSTADQLPLAQIERRRRRLHVLSPIWKSITTIFLVIVGLLLAYSLFSLSTGLTLFTEIGVLGVAASLAFQSSIKDALAGWMFLAQDAFTVGDVVTVKEASGVVEAMGLFMTKIRNSPGDLITLRNGEITSVTNRSKDWSRMDFTVLVDYGTDIKQALITMREVFQTMQTDPDWSRQLVGEPDILGVEQFESNGIRLKIRAQTQAGQQFALTREFQLRLNQAFNGMGITIPIPQQEIRYRESKSRDDASKHVT